MREAVGVQVFQGEFEVLILVVDALAAVEEPLQTYSTETWLPVFEQGREFFVSEFAAFKLGADKVKA